MKTYFHAYIMCQSMFCAIPCPSHIWDENAKDKMLIFLPWVGLLIGLLWWALSSLCLILQLPSGITAFILAIYPFLATGYMHLDGFMDVTDAVKSCRNLDRRREILKDSHVGSFSVISCILLISGQFAIFSALPVSARRSVLILIPAISRCCSALAVAVLPTMSTSQYAKQKLPRSHVVILLFTLCTGIALGFLLWKKNGLVLIAELAGYCLFLHHGYHALEGMNGDIAGYALTYAELIALAALVLM